MVTCGFGRRAAVYERPSFRRSSSGSLAMFAAIRHASSVVSSLAAARRLGLVLEIEMPQLFPGRTMKQASGFLGGQGGGKRR